MGGSTSQAFEAITRHVSRLWGSRERACQDQLGEERSQVSDFVLYSSSNLLEPVTQLHLLGSTIFLQGSDDLKGRD